MGDTPGRMLELLGLLQRRSSWSAAQLADRLEVTQRTVRRDVDRLRLLGYPVEGLQGRYGGYCLGRGGSLPPLMLGDDEAVAVAIGLRAAADGSIAGIEDAATSVLAKLDQLLPTHLALRVRAVHDYTTSIQQRRRPERINASDLVLLARACEAQERVRFDYVDKGGAASNRLVEPLRVVRTGGRWYLVALDAARADWRTFRIDRLRRPENVGTHFDLVDAPDAVSLVTAGFASMPYPFTARIRIGVGLDQVAKLIPRTAAMISITDEETIVELGSDTIERMTSYLAGLRPACEVLDPPELRRALTDHLRKVAAMNE